MNKAFNGRKKQEKMKKVFCNRQKCQLWHQPCSHLKGRWGINWLHLALASNVATLGSLVTNCPMLNLPRGPCPNCGKALEDGGRSCIFLPHRKISWIFLEPNGQRLTLPWHLVPCNTVKFTMEKPKLTGQIAGSSLLLLIDTKTISCSLWQKVSFSDLWQALMVSPILSQVMSSSDSLAGLLPTATAPRLLQTVLPQRLPGQFWVYNNFRCKGKICHLLMIQTWELKSQSLNYPNRLN